MKTPPRSSRRPPARAFLLVALACSGFCLPVAAQEPAAAPVPAADSRPDPEQRELLAVRNAFSAALRAGDLATVERLLAPDALVLESGGAERSRAEYLARHAPADAAFLATATVEGLSARVERVGDLAWIASESRIRYTKDGVAKTLASTETLVLRRGPEGWRIAHIHWSSSPAP